MASAGPSGANQAAPRVITPTLPEPVVQMETKGFQIAQIAEKGIEHETSKIDTDSSEYDDMRVVTAYYHSVHWKENCKMQETNVTHCQDMIVRQLKGLRWRYGI